MRNTKPIDKAMCATAVSGVHVRRRGAILLEVVVSLGLLVAAMAVVGAQINTSLSMAHATDIRTRTLLLVDTKMAELDAGVLNPSWAGDDLRGYFGVAYPGYSWRMRVKPAEIPNLYLVWLDIGFNENQVNRQVDNPDMEIHIDDPDTQILRTVYRLVPKPADVSMQRDFGISQEEMDAMVAAAAVAGDANAGAGSDIGGALAGGGGAGGGGGVPANNGGSGNNADITGMLTKLIQAIVSGGLDPNSINPRDLAQYLDDETMEQLGPLIDMYFGNGPDSGTLPGPLDNPLIRSMLGPKVPTKPPKNDPNVDPTPDNDPSKPGPKPDPKTEPRPGPKADPRPGPKADPRPDPKTPTNGPKPNPKNPPNPRK